MPVRTDRQEDTQALLSQSTVLQQRFDLLSVTDSQGHVIASEGGAVAPYVGDRPYFERAKQLRRPVRSALHDDGAGRRVVAVAVPYYDRAGRFGGCVLGIWDLAGDRLGAPVESIRVGEQGYAFLVDRDGSILYHPDQNLLGAGWQGHPAVAAVAIGHADAQTVRWRSERTIIAYAPIPLTRLASSLVADESWEGWGLLTSQLWEDIVAPLEPYLVLMLFLLLLALLLPLGFLAMNSRRIVAPLQSLVAVLAGVLLLVVLRWFIGRTVRSVVSGSARVRRRAQALLQRTPARAALDSDPLAVARRVQRAETLGSVLRSASAVVVAIVVVTAVANINDWDLGPVLASAGVLGVALGFGAQTLVKDWLSGLFMLMEDQYGVGDVVDLGDASGTVEAVSLRITRLRPSGRGADSLK